MDSAEHSMRLEPQVVLVDWLLEQVESGRIRVPRFQRPFVWGPHQMLQLFDSIESSYPIGSLLLWQADKPMEAIEQIGGIAVPTGAAGHPVSYVLDGHQRLSTLYGVLRRARDAVPTGSQDDWRWSIYRALGEDARERYRHHRRAGAPPAHYLPLRAVSRTMDFLEFSRGLELHRLDRGALAELVRQAEAVAQKIKNYQITLVRLVGGTLDEAVEVYTRLNRMGTRIDADQMVSALTYRRTDRPSLAQRIDDLTASVAEGGFGVVPRTAVFRTVLAVAGESDVMSPSWEAVAGRLNDRMYQAVPDAEQAIRAAVGFLQSDVPLPLARFLPYAHQLMLLGVFFHHCQEPSPRQREELRRWFWVTSWSDRFAGASYALIRTSVEEMTAFARGDGKLTFEVERVQPVPDRFNLNSARTLAYVTWELQEFPARRDAAGNPIDLVRLLASSDAKAFRPVVERNPHPANRVVLPTPAGMSVRQALVETWAPDRDAVLASHGIPLAAWDRLCEGDGDGFVRGRAEHLAQRLRRFTDDLRITGTVDLTGSSEDDSAEYGTD